MLLRERLVTLATLVERAADVDRITAAQRAILAQSVDRIRQHHDPAGEAS